ncbi:MAG: histidine kinase, partial [bacterium]|nr:histidine kinase [bacterium]
MISLYVFSQNAKFEHITIDDGLSQNTVIAIHQDSKGFLWFGTEDGLNRYDGYDLKVYKKDPDDPGTLSSNWIQAIHEDKSGTLWCATRGGGLNRFSRSRQTFIHYRHEPGNPDSLSHDIIWALYEDPKGNLWLGTDNGLNRFDVEKEIFTCWKNSPEIPGSISSNRIKTICANSKNSRELWIGTSRGGLNLFDGIGEF